MFFFADVENGSESFSLIKTKTNCLSQLISLRIDSNKLILKLLPLMFQNFTYLKHLNLNNVKINVPVSIPIATFAGLRNLTHLGLAQIQLEHFDHNIFASTPNLTHLDLSYNILKLNSLSFTHLEKLECLDLSGNYLKSLPDNVFSKQTRLKTLNLSNNQLYYIRGDMFKHLESLKNLDISFNRIFGDKSFIHFLMRNKLVTFEKSDCYLVGSNLKNIFYILIILVSIILFIILLWKILEKYFKNRIEFVFIIFLAFCVILLLLKQNMRNN